MVSTSQRVVAAGKAMMIDPATDLAWRTLKTLRSILEAQLTTLEKFNAPFSMPMIP